MEFCYCHLMFAILTHRDKTLCKDDKATHNVANYDLFYWKYPRRNVNEILNKNFILNEKGNFCRVH